MSQAAAFGVKLAKARVATPNERARELMLLMEGAMALMLIHGDPGYIDAAARAGKRLVRQDDWLDF